MKKVLQIVIVSLIAVMGTSCRESIQKTLTDQNLNESPTSVVTEELSKVKEDIGYQNATFEIEGKTVSLVNGVSEVEAAPGSATKIITKYFGNEAFGDLNGDGKKDVAFLITQDGGGSGTFYYVVAALQSETGYHGTNAILLGDRIAPQTTQIENGQIVVNYAERKPGDSFTTQPSLAVSKRVKVLNGKLVEGLKISPSITITNPAVPVVDLNISKSINEISNLAGWKVLSPNWLPDGYQFNEALFDSANKMVTLTFIATHPIQGSNPIITQTNVITLVESLRNDLIPLIVAPDADIGSMIINGQAAAYTIGAWKNDKATGTATWDSTYQLQTINWQIDSTYLSINTNDTLVSKDDLLRVAESTK